MLAVMVLSQHRVSTSKTVSPRIPVGARCTGHVRMMCSAVCSAAPHSQFDVGARPDYNSKAVYPDVVRGDDWPSTNGSLS